MRTRPGTGSISGIRPTGGQAAFASIEINRAGADGRFAEHWSSADLPGVLHRLRVAPELSLASAAEGMTSA